MHLRNASQSLLERRTELATNMLIFGLFAASAAAADVAFVLEAAPSGEYCTDRGDSPSDDGLECARTAVDPGDLGDGIERFGAVVTQGPDGALLGQCTACFWVDVPC